MNEYNYTYHCDGFQNVKAGVLKESILAANYRVQSIEFEARSIKIQFGIDSFFLLDFN